MRALVDGQGALEQSQRLRVLVCLVVQRAHVEARHCHVRVVAAEYDKRRMEFICRRGLRMHCRALDRHSISGSTVALLVLHSALPPHALLLDAQRALVVLERTVEHLLLLVAVTVRVRD